ncbi:MAG: hypothetical protein ACYTEX_18195 [Planctomycetota bacterium]|jgi:hypothetical protein
MTSEAKTLANRQNAQESTGPRTPHGKAVASLPVSPRHCRGFLLLTTGSSLNPGAPGLPTLPTRPQTKNLLLRNEPKSSWYPKITNPFIAKAYEAKAAFSLSRKRTQTAQKKKRTQTFLVDKDHKSCFCKGLRRPTCIFVIKKTNPNEPKLPRKKRFFTKRTQLFLVLKVRKSLFCKGLRRQGCIFAIKKTNPNEPNFSARYAHPSSLIPRPRRVAASSEASRWQRPQMSLEPRFLVANVAIAGKMDLEIEPCRVCNLFAHAESQGDRWSIG